MYNTEEKNIITYMLSNLETSINAIIPLPLESTPFDNF